MHVETRVRDALRRISDGAAAHKEAVHRALIKRIIEEDGAMKRKRTRGRALLSAAAAVAVFAAVFAATPAGSALADRIIRFFAPEKQVEVNIEGDKEDQNARLETNATDEMGYVIYIDAERYTFESKAGMDVVGAKDFPTGYPPVRMEISQRAEQSAQSAYDALVKQAQADYDRAEGMGGVDAPVKGLWIHAIDDGGGEAAVENIYIVDNTRGGCFVIRAKLFLEAEEGHGARFYAMLETFEVVPSEQINAQ
jgi:hypothetical protein